MAHASSLPIDYCRSRKAFKNFRLVSERPKPRAHAPAFSRAALRNLRALSGLTNPAKVLAWWRVQMGMDDMNVTPACNSRRKVG